MIRASVVDPEQPPRRVSRLRRGPRRRYAFVAFSGQILQAVLMLAGAVLAARLFGPSGKGELTAWTLGMIVAGLVFAGQIPGGMGIASLSGLPELRPALLRHLKLVVVAMVPVAVVALLLGVDPIPVVTIGVIGVPAAVVFTDLVSVMTAAKRATASYLLRIIRPAFLAVGLGLGALLSADLDLDLAYVLVGLGSIGTTLVGLRLVSVPRGATALPLGEANQLGTGTWLSGVNTLLIKRLDYFAVVVISGPTGLGIYSVAVNFTELTQYAGNAMAQAAFEGEATLDDVQARRLLRSAITIAGPLALLVLVAGTLAIEPVFGAGFSDARVPLWLLSPGIIALGPAAMAGSILMARGRGPALARLTTRLVLTAIPLWIAATLAFDIEGAAAASSVVYMIQAVASRRLLLGRTR